MQFCGFAKHWMWCLEAILVSLIFPLFFAGTKMERGISRVTNNEDLINKARCQVEQDFSSVTLESKSTSTETDHPESPPKLNTLECFETPVYTFTLPDITRYPGTVMTKRICTNLQSYMYLQYIVVDCMLRNSFMLYS